MFCFFVRFYANAASPHTVRKRGKVARDLTSEPASGRLVQVHNTLQSQCFLFLLFIPCCSCPRPPLRTSCGKALARERVVWFKPTIHRYRFGLDMPFLAFSSTACGGAPSRREPEERGERVVCGQVWQGEPKNPECESVQDFYFLPLHYSLFTQLCIQDFLKVIVYSE